jgi:hypothetical protein
MGRTILLSGLGAAMISAFAAVAVLAGRPAAPGGTIPSARALAAEPPVVPLPAESRTLGTEASELRALAHGDAGAGTPTRAPARVLFASAPTGSDAVLPAGLHRAEFGAGDDGVAAYLAELARGDQAHATLRLAIKRSGRYGADVERVLRAWHVPEELSAIPFVESAFVPGAVGPERGAGLWALPPDVADAYGLVMTSSYDERRSVVLATEVAAHYLSDLRERLGSWELAVCGFGLGYAPALSALSSQEPNGPWGPMPRDGVAYVRAVTAVVTALANPERFGFDVQPDAPTTASDLEVPAGATFRIVARAAATTVERLRELNPEYLTDVVPNAGIPMVVHLPAEGLARAKESLLPLLYATGSGERPSPRSAKEDTGSSAARSPTGGVPAGRGRSYYRVRDGETLEGIAARFGVPSASIAEDNALDPTASLRGGKLLLIAAPAASNASPGDSHARH